MRCFAYVTILVVVSVISQVESQGRVSCASYCGNYCQRQGFSSASCDINQQCSCGNGGGSGGQANNGGGGGSLEAQCKATCPQFCAGYPSSSCDANGKCQCGSKLAQCELSACQQKCRGQGYPTGNCQGVLCSCGYGFGGK